MEPEESQQLLKVKHTSKEPFDLRPTPLAPQQPPILHWHTTPDFVETNRLHTLVLRALFIHTVTVERLVSVQSFGQCSHNPRLQCGGGDFYFNCRNTICLKGESKTVAVCNTCDLGVFTPSDGSHQLRPFLAGTKVRSTKHLLRYMPPTSLGCCANVWKRRSKSVLSHYAVPDLSVNVFSSTVG